MAEVVTEEVREHRRRLQRRSKKLAELGRPQYVLPHEFERALRIARKARASGMTLEQIGDQVGVGKSTIQMMLSGKRKSMYRHNYEKMLGLRPETPMSLDGTRRGGARMSPLGAQRRLRALYAAGWSATMISPFAGADHRNLSDVLRGEVAYIFAISHNKIAEAYDKLQHMDPADCGGSVIGMNRSKARAQRERWAPPWAWDEDTIDDPKASPEWTGACGTADGYRIHLREDIPPCGRCLESVGRSETAGAFSPAKFRILLDRAGWSTDEAAEKMGASRDSISRWSAGERNPAPRYVEAMCVALDCTEADLFDASGEIFYDKDFNRIVFTDTLERRGMSRRQLAAEIGVSGMAVHHWMSGRAKPRIPKMVRAAEVLGVDWKDFYR